MNPSIEEGLDEFAERVRPRPVEEIRRRATEIRRGRGIGSVSAAAALTAIVTVAPVVVPLGGGQVSSQVQANGCDYGASSLVDRASLPWRYLFDGDTGGRRLLWAAAERDDWGTCPLDYPVVTMVDLSADGTRPVRALSLAPSHALVGRTPNSTGVRGVYGKFRYDPATSSAALTWTEPDGTPWQANSSGIGQGDLLAAVNRLRLDGDQVAPASLPSGFEDVHISAMSPVRESTNWTAVYGDRMNSKDAVEVMVTSLPSMLAPASPAGRDLTRLRFTKVGGVRAMYTDVPGRSNSLTWVKDGVSFKITGPFGETELVAWASRLVSVSDTDPRLHGVPDRPR